MHQTYLSRRACIAFIVSLFLLTGNVFGQGTWTPIASPSPDYNSGIMLLLPDGSVLCKSVSGGGYYGDSWDKLTPDIHGSYANGTWSVMTPMSDERLYFSSQVMKDGRVYIAGGEYGSGYNKGEVYDPLTDTWTPVPPLTPLDTFYDANSAILPDGRILQSAFSNYGHDNYIYNPATNSYTAGPSNIGSHLETTWLKMPDASILFADWIAYTSERYIPASGTWVADAVLPVSLYDPVAFETGGANVLPDGRAFFMSGDGITAYYTPSGTTSPGVWAAGPLMPGGLGMPDAPSCMMADGKLLLTATPSPHDADLFPDPVYFYEFNYLTNTFTQITGPDGLDTLSASCFMTNMLNLPDGSVLFSTYSSQQYYEYTPSGPQLAAGKPTVDSVFKINCDTFKITGKLFNGITEGTTYGDDGQMATNFPIIRLKSGTNVYYCRSYNWNRTGIMTGALPDTAMFSLPAALPNGTYTLELVVNGIASTGRTFKTCLPSDAEMIVKEQNNISIHPNPANGRAEVVFHSNTAGSYVIRLQDMMGRTISQETGTSAVGENRHIVHLDGMATGLYIVAVQNEGSIYQAKLSVK